LDELQRLERARERVVESISNNMNLYGVTPSIGRLYGMMYFHNQPMTLDEMKEHLGMSKTSMSTSVRALLDLKMVEKVWKKGVRKDLYAVEEDWYQTFIELFCIKWRAGVSLNISAIRKSLDDLDQLMDVENTSDHIREQAVIDKQKLQRALEYYLWLNRLVDSFESQEIFDFIPKTKGHSD
jgi:DNA-binding transcriptional regulator GbsR (MarR family)